MRILIARRPSGGFGTTGRRAFSLIEAMMATALISVSFVSLYAAIAYGFAAVEVSRENLRATQVMLEKLETLRLYSWDQINTPGFVPSTFQAPFNPSTNAVGGFLYQGTVTITNAPISESYSNDMRLVSVTVNWTSGNIPRARQMGTLVSRYGLQNYIY
jgi:type II secretory pathway pseudopilin PulG